MWPDLVAKYRSPAIGPKKGAYTVRGPSTTGYRDDDSIPFADMVILDGDKRFDSETGELLDGAPNPAAVHRVLKEADITHVIHSSYSNDIDRHRYRILIHCHCSDAEQLHAAIDWTIKLLQDNGVPLATVSENYAWSQPWYTPRVPEEKQRLFEFFEHTSNKPFPLDEAVTWWKETQPEDDGEDFDYSASKPASYDGDSAIARFNDAVGTSQTLLRILENRSYELKGTGRKNGDVKYMLRAPESSSGPDARGVTLIHHQEWKTNPAKDKWLVGSFHGEHDPLAKRTKEGKVIALDAFDVFTQLEHKGDYKASWRHMKVLEQFCAEEEVELSEAVIDRLDKAYDPLSPDSFMDIGKMLNTEPKPRRYQFSDANGTGIIPEGEICGCAGPGAVGKSYLILQCAIAKACGQSWLGIFDADEPSPVYFLTVEDDEEEIHRRVANILNQYKEDVDNEFPSFEKELPDSVVELLKKNLKIRSLRGVNFDLLERDPDKSYRRGKGAEAVVDLLNREGTGGLVVFDPLRNMIQGEETGEAFSALIRVLHWMIKKASVPITPFISHHTAQASMAAKDMSEAAFRGASDLKDGMRWTMVIQRVDEKKAKKLGRDASQATNIRQLSMPKINYGEAVSGGLFIEWTGDGFKGINPEDIRANVNDLAFAEAVQDDLRIYKAAVEVIEIGDKATCPNIIKFTKAHPAFSNISKHRVESAYQRLKTYGCLEVSGNTSAMTVTAAAAPTTQDYEKLSGVFKTAPNNRGECGESAL